MKGYIVRRQNSQSGSAHLILLSLILVAVLGGLGYLFWKNTVGLEPKPATSAEVSSAKAATSNFVSNLLFNNQSTDVTEIFESDKYSFDNLTNAVKVQLAFMDDESRLNNKLNADDIEGILKDKYLIESTVGLKNEVIGNKKYTYDSADRAFSASAEQTDSESNSFNKIFFTIRKTVAQDDQIFTEVDFSFAKIDVENCGDVCTNYVISLYSDVEMIDFISKHNNSGDLSAAYLNGDGGTKYTLHFERNDDGAFRLSYIEK